MHPPQGRTFHCMSVPDEEAMGFMAHWKSLAVQQTSGNNAHMLLDFSIGLSHLGVTIRPCYTTNTRSGWPHRECNDTDCTGEIGIGTGSTQPHRPLDILDLSCSTSPYRRSGEVGQLRDFFTSTMGAVLSLPRTSSSSLFEFAYPICDTLRRIPISTEWVIDIIR